MGLALLSRAGPGLARSEPIWVLLSDSSALYTQAASALDADWAGSSNPLVILHSSELRPGRPAALVTLGSAALRVAQEHVRSNASWAHVPVLAGLLPQEAFEAIWPDRPPWVSAAWLDQPVPRYLDLIRLALPRLTRVGVVLGLQEQATRIALTSAAQERGLRLVAGSVRWPNELYASLHAVLAESDVLLMLPGRTVGGASVVQNMLITAYRRRIPVVAYSAPLVNAGAALGLYTSAAQAGRQLARLLKSAWSAAALEPRWPRPQQADDFTISVNEQVCRSLGLDVPVVSELTAAVRARQGAAPGSPGYEPAQR